MSQPADPPAQPPNPRQQATLSPPPATEVVQQLKQKRFGFLALGITALITLLVSLGISAARDNGTTTTARPAPTVTRTVTEPVVVEGGGEPTEEPGEELEPTGEPAAWNPKPEDFKVGIRVLKKTCSGELGCDVYFRIEPSYVGSQEFPARGVTEVTYEVTGGKDPITNTFEMDANGTASFDEEESAEIATSSRKLVARATEVSYDEFR